MWWRRKLLHRLAQGPGDMWPRIRIMRWSTGGPPSTRSGSDDRRQSASKA